MKKKSLIIKAQIVIVMSLLSFSAAVSAQQRIDYQLEAQAIGTTNNVTPFWFRSNQYGSIPLEGASTSLIGVAKKEYNPQSKGRFNWGGRLEGRINIGSKSQFLLIEASARLKLGVFQLKAGRTKDVMGINGDTTLSSGNFAISGNALGIPKVDLSIPDYYVIPIFNEIFAIKGNFAHGWLGRMLLMDSIRQGNDKPIKYPVKNNQPTTYFHQLSFYGRIGKETSATKLYGGFSHNVFWGGEKALFGDEYTLSPIETLFYVATGKTYGTALLPSSKLGNQLGSIDLALEHEFKTVKIKVYRQNLYDVGALAKLANIRDGLNGISIENNKKYIDKNDFHWKRVLLEFLYTKHQAGEIGSKATKSGDEDYYNNYLYKNGWSYYGLGLGSPFLSTKQSVRSGLPSHPPNYFINNRVVAFHAGMDVILFDCSIKAKLSYSNNFGTFLTSPDGLTARDDPSTLRFGIFGKKTQFSSYLEANKPIAKRLTIGVAGAVDIGDLLYNSSGVMIRVIQSF